MINSTACNFNAEAQISHELRIPLTGIMGMVSFFNESPVNSQQKQYLQTIFKLAKQLLGLENYLYSTFKSHKKISFSARGMLKTIQLLAATMLNVEQKEYVRLMIISAYRLQNLKHKIFNLGVLYDKSCS